MHTTKVSIKYFHNLIIFICVFFFSLFVMTFNGVLATFDSMIITGGIKSVTDDKLKSSTTPELCTIHKHLLKSDSIEE